MRILAAVAASVVLLSGCGVNAPQEPSQRLVLAEDPPPARVAREPAPTAADPVRIEIPAIKVKARIMTIGRNPDKSMETPPGNKRLVGWFSPKVAAGVPPFPRPGEVGAAVIAGHVDHRDGPDVFYRLRELKAGAEILITDADGKVHRFEVTGRKQTDKDELPTDDIWNDPDYPALRLITCGGSFDKASGHYTENITIFADAA